jgi:hypothetical protein
MAMTHDKIVMNGISTVNRIIDDNMFLQLRFADRYWIDGITFYVIPGLDEMPDATKSQLKVAALTLESQSICFNSEWESNILYNANDTLEKGKGKHKHLDPRQNVIGVSRSNFMNLRRGLQDLFCVYAFSNNTNPDSDSTLLCTLPYPTKVDPNNKPGNFFLTKLSRDGFWGICDISSIRRPPLQ